MYNGIQSILYNCGNVLLPICIVRDFWPFLKIILAFISFFHSIFSISCYFCYESSSLLQKLPFDFFQTRHTVSCELSWKRCTTRRSPRPPVSNTEDPSLPTVSTSSCPCPKSTDAWSEVPPSMPRNSDASSTSRSPNKQID